MCGGEEKEIRSLIKVADRSEVFYHEAHTSDSSSLHPHLHCHFPAHPDCQALQGVEEL